MCDPNISAFDYYDFKRLLMHQLKLLKVLLVKNECCRDDDGDCKKHSRNASYTIIMFTKFVIIPFQIAADAEKVLSEALPSKKRTVAVGPVMHLMLFHF